MQKEYKVIFVLGSISQPRCIKRINSFLEHGIELEIYGFDRGKQNINAVVQGKEIFVLAKLGLGKNYVSNFFQMFKAIGNLNKQYKNEKVVYYSFGFLPTLLIKILGTKHYVYEISDLLYGYKKFDLLRWILKPIDKYLVKKSILTVMTSKGFVNYLFKSIQPKNVIIQPNRLDSLHFSKKISYKPISPENKIIFAFVGAFRSPETIFRFANIVGGYYPNYEFHFYGDSHLTKDVITISNQFENVKYFGPFKNPGQLTEIYEKIDVLISCYNNKELNEKILEPNKLYEALFFNKPIIVSENTYLAERVKYYNCGYAINAIDDNSIFSFLDNLDYQSLNGKMKNIEKIELKEMIDDNSVRIVKYLNENL